MTVASEVGVDLPIPTVHEGLELATHACEHRTVMLPDKGWKTVDFGELWRYRELLLFLCWRDIKVRYKQTVLGAAWAVLQPAMMMGVFTIFFSQLGGMSSGTTPYPLFVLAGLLPWFFFSSSVANAGNSVIGSERLITKIYFPRLTVPFASVGAALVDFAVALILLLLMMGIYRCEPSSNIILAPLIVFVIVLMAAGLGSLLAALNVVYRDVRYVIPFLIQMGLFATPTIYLQPRENESETIRWLLMINPMTGLIGGFRASVLGGPMPWTSLGVATLSAVAMFLFGCLYFRRTEDRFADII